MPETRRSVSKMSHQDWTPVIISKNQKTGPIKDKDLNVARRKGENIVTEKKFLGGTNKATKNVCPNAAKLDEDTGDYHVDRVSFEFSKALQQARQAKGMTQAQLAAAISEKQSVINDYEAGRAIPNGQLITKLNRALGVRLPPARAQKKKLDDE